MVTHNPFVRECDIPVSIFEHGKKLFDLRTHLIRILNATEFLNKTEHPQKLLKNRASKATLKELSIHSNLKNQRYFAAWF